jgi:hypothetical protein
VKLQYTPRAQREIERALKWWTENRPLVPTMLADELDAYLDKLLLKPDLGEPWGEFRKQAGQFSLAAEMAR